MLKLWRVLAKSLGEKAGSTDKEADRVAILRSLIMLHIIITNTVIICGVLRHW